MERKLIRSENAEACFTLHFSLSSMICEMTIISPLPLPSNRLRRCPDRFSPGARASRPPADEMPMAPTPCKLSVGALACRLTFAPRRAGTYARRMETDEGSTEDSLDLSSSPHDAFFKSVFSEPEYAVGFFRKHLPPAISAAADWDGLQVIPGSFVKSQLSQIHSDLLFSLEIGERRCLLYLLLEHQSTVDPTMPLIQFTFPGIL